MGLARNVEPAVKLTNERVRKVALVVAAIAYLFRFVAGQVPNYVLPLRESRFPVSPEFTETDLLILNICEVIWNYSNPVMIGAIFVFLICVHREMKQLQHPHACPSCGYDRYGKPEGACPECGEGA